MEENSHGHDDMRTLHQIIRFEAVHSTSYSRKKRDAASNIIIRYSPSFFRSLKGGCKKLESNPVQNQKADPSKVFHSYPHYIQSERGLRSVRHRPSNSIVTTIPRSAPFPTRGLSFTPPVYLLLELRRRTTSTPLSPFTSPVLQFPLLLPLRDPALSTPSALDRSVEEKRGPLLSSTRKRAIIAAQNGTKERE